MSQLHTRLGRKLKYADTVRTDLKLLEVSEDLLQEIVSSGVTIKGGIDEEAVLVSSSRTFALKFVETTNLQMMVAPEAHIDWTDLEEENEGQENQQPPNVSLPGLQTQLARFATSKAVPPVTVCATNCSHIEVVEVAPKLQRLEALLSLAPYSDADAEAAEGGPQGQDVEMAEDGKGVNGQEIGFTFQELLDTVQASELELRNALKAAGAIELNGRWRQIDPMYLGTLLELVILTAEQEGMELSNILESTVSDSLAQDGYRRALVRHCLHTYGSQKRSATRSVPSQDTEEEASSAANDMEVAKGSDIDPNAPWVLSEQKVCVHFLRKMLTEKSWTLREFMAEWQRRVPSCMTPTQDMLAGEALLDGSSSDPAVHPFPASSLPTDPTLRFNTLFAQKPRWEAAELMPYISSVVVPGMNMGGLLLKYTRASQPTPDAPVVYTARMV